MKDELEVVESYFDDMTNFNMKEFFDYVRPKSKYDWCNYFMIFSHKLHKPNFMADLAMYHVTFEHGHRPNDIVEENKHLLKEFFEEMKNEDPLFMEYGIQSMMPIRYYFKEEMKEIVEYFNNLVDTMELSEDQRKRRKFRLYGI